MKVAFRSKRQKGKESKWKANIADKILILNN